MEIRRLRVKRGMRVGGLIGKGVVKVLEVGEVGKRERREGRKRRAHRDFDENSSSSIRSFHLDRLDSKGHLCGTLVYADLKEWTIDRFSTPKS